MTSYDSIRSAISTSLRNVDPTMRSYDYIINPIDTSNQKAFELFGVTIAGEKILNGSFFTRKRPGVFADVYATGPQDEIRFGSSLWEIHTFHSVQDPIVDPSIRVPSEYAFQNKVDAIMRQLFLDSSIQLLMDQSIVAESVSGDETWFQDLFQEIRCHYAIISLTMRHPVNKVIL